VFGILSGAKQAAEKVVVEPKQQVLIRMTSKRAGKSVPQRLKPYCKCGVYGTDESVPLSKTGFFRSLFSPVA